MAQVFPALWYAPDAKRWVKHEYIDRGPEGRVVEQRRYDLMQVELQK